VIENPAARLALHWLPAVMLVTSLGAWPYGYYMLLRVVVCVAAAMLLVGDVYRRAGKITLWCAAFAATAMLFNPLVPVHLTRAIWAPINLAGAALFAVHFFVQKTAKDASSD